MPVPDSWLQFFRRLWLVLFLAGAVLGSWLLVSDQAVVWPIISLKAEWLLVALVLQVGFWFGVSWCWRQIFKYVTSGGLSMPDALFQIALVNVGKYLPGKVWGMVARGAFLAQQHGTSAADVVRASLIEQLNVLVSGAVVCLGLVAWLEADGIAALGAVIVFVMFVFGQRYWSRILGALPFIGRAISARLGNGGLECTGSWGRSLIFLGYAVVWLVLGLVFLVLDVALFDRPRSLVTAGRFALACVFGVCAGFLAVFAPGGFGVREAGSLGLLAKHYPLEEMVVVVAVFRLWLAVFEVGSAGVLVVARKLSELSELRS